MATPQQPGIRRSGLNPGDPKHVKSRGRNDEVDESGETGPVPAENQPGHHPEHEQDKPEL